MYTDFLNALSPHEVDAELARKIEDIMSHCPPEYHAAYAFGRWSPSSGWHIHGVIDERAIKFLPGGDFKFAIIRTEEDFRKWHRYAQKWVRLYRPGSENFWRTLATAEKFLSDCLLHGLTAHTYPHFIYKIGLPNSCTAVEKASRAERQQRAFEEQWLKLEQARAEQAQALKSERLRIKHAEAKQARALKAQRRTTLISAIADVMALLLKHKNSVMRLQKVSQRGEGRPDVTPSMVPRTVPADSCGSSRARDGPKPWEVNGHAPRHPPHPPHHRRRRFSLTTNGQMP